MSRQEMIEALAAMGFDTTAINDGVPDEFLAQVLAALSPEPEPAPVAAMADMTRDEMVAALLENGHSQEELDAKSDEEIKAMFDAEFPASPPADAAMGELEDMIAALVAKGYAEADLAGKSVEELKAMLESAPAVASMSDKGKHDRVIKMSELSGIVAGIVQPILRAAEGRFAKRLSTISRQTDSLDRNAKKANVVKFCEALRDQGKILPREFEGVVSRLLRADHTQRVHKFSEGDKVKMLTELDLQMNELNERPILLSFAERMKQPVSTTDSEVAQVESHWQAFSENYKGLGQTQEKFVGAFKKMRSDNPRLTAKEFCAGAGK